MEKLKFLQHLEWRNEESLAARLWRCEKEERIEGLKDEIEETVAKFNLPPPTRMLSKKQYNNQLTKRIKEESRKEIRENLMMSRKLQYLAGAAQDRAPQLAMTDIKRIQFLTRCRLACHFEFEGDFGSETPCVCGENDSLAHVRRGCPAYIDILPRDTAAYFGIEETEELYEKIMERKRQLRRNLSEQGTSPGTPAACSPPPPSHPTPPPPRQPPYRPPTANGSHQPT